MRFLYKKEAFCLERLFKNSKLFAIVLTIAMALLVACGGTNSTEKTNTNKQEATTETKQDFPVTITDDADREVTIEKKPKTIISVQASNTENLFAFGAGERVVGVSDFCNYPEAVENIEKIGGQDMDVEKILELLPDLIFVTDYHYKNHKDILKQYEDAGIAVVVTGSAGSFAEAYETMEMMAKAIGAKKEADQIITDMKKRHEAIKEKAKSITDKKRVWVEVSPGPDIFTTGTGTFMNEMLESIQAINVAADQEGWVKLTEEEIVQYNPDVIITTYGYYVENPKEEVLQRAGWAEVPAVKNKQVFDVDSDTVTRPGPRLIEGVETLGKLIYPEIFNE